MIFQKKSHLKYCLIVQRWSTKVNYILLTSYPDEIEKIESLSKFTKISNIDAQLYATVFDVEKNQQVPRIKRCLSNRDITLKE